MFSAVVGHEKVKNVLTVSKNENRVGHAYIFEGPQGVGRQTMAKEFGKLLLCENPGQGEPCGVCKSCSMCETGNHPDLQVITNQLYDASKKSTDVLVDTVRSMKKDIFIKPFASERKIYIVPNADTMNVYAQNSLLKVLEEPPEYCTIILLAENANMFLPTILSRTVTLKFFPLYRNDVEAYLGRMYPELGESVAAIASMSEGSIGKAKKLIEADNVTQLRDGVFDCVANIADKGNKPVYDMALFIKQNKDNIRLVMDIMQGLFRDLMFLKQTENYDGIINADKLSQLEKIRDKIRYDSPVKMLEILLKYNEYFSRNISHAQIAQCMSLELWEVMHD